MRQRRRGNLRSLIPNMNTQNKTTIHADKWHYIGDVNIEYGGAFFDLTDWKYGYVNAVRVEDLDGACGFDGACLIEKITIRTDNNEQNKSAMECRGCNLSDIDMSTDDGKLQLADAVLSYGYYDSESQDEIVQTQDDAPMEFDGWKATKHISPRCLRAYVESKLD